MKFSFSWLKDYLETDLSADEVGVIGAQVGVGHLFLIGTQPPGLSLFSKQGIFVPPFPLI